MRKIKFVILILILLIGGLALIRVWGNLEERKASDKGEVQTISTRGATVQLERIRLVEDKSGIKTWELEAKSIQQYQDKNMMVLEDVKVTFYAKDGQAFTLSGNQGKVYQDSKDMELVGDVVLSSKDGYRLKTHSISYKNSEKKATTSDPVEIEGEQIQLVGKGMLVDMEAKTFKILSQVKTQLKGDGKR
jgi:LPS export ABC transporter protein LptC